MTASDVAVFIDPFSPRTEQDRLFDPASAPGTGDSTLTPFAHLRSWLNERGVEVHTADMLDARRPNGRVNLYLSLGMRQRYRRLARRPDVLLSGFFAFECPIVLPGIYRELHEIGQAFRRVFSYSSEAALRPFLRGPVHLSHFMWPQPFDDVHEGIWERGDRKLLVMVNANKVTRVRVNELYTERLRSIEFFNRRGELDLYGLGWDGPPIQLGRRVPGAVERLERRARRRWESLRPPTDPVRVAIREAYRGPTSRKAETLGGYRFALCFENSALEGWITEKIFDCFYAGTVPVYWGAPDVERWIPPECFIDMRRFEGYDDLRDFLLSLTDDEVDGYRVAARDFLRSERFRPFSKQTFAERIGGLIEEDAGVALGGRFSGLGSPRASAR